MEQLLKLKEQMLSDEYVKQNFKVNAVKVTQRIEFTLCSDVNSFDVQVQDANLDNPQLIIRIRTSQHDIVRDFYNVVPAIDFLKEQNQIIIKNNITVFSGLDMEASELIDILANAVNNSKDCFSVRFQEIWTGDESMHMELNSYRYETLEEVEIRKQKELAKAQAKIAKEKAKLEKIELDKQAKIAKLESELAKLKGELNENN